MTHMLWLNLAPLATLIQERFQVGEWAVSALLLVFPLLFILLSMHSGALIDRKGARYSILMGGAITVAAAPLRALDGHFEALLLGQLGIAVGQPYIVNAVSSLVAGWFPPAERPAATGIGTAGVLVGMAVGLGATPLVNEALGLAWTMAVFSLVALVLFLLFWAATRGVRPPGLAATQGAAPVRLRALLGNRALVQTAVMWFFAFGAFNGLTTWLEPILGQHGVTPVAAGLVGASIIVGGIGGSLVVPALAQRLGGRRAFLGLGCLSALLLLWPLCSARMPGLLPALAGLLGFLFLPGYPLVLGLSEELVEAPAAGSAVSLLMLVGNAGAVAAILAMPALATPEGGWAPAVGLLWIFFAIPLGILWRMPARVFQGRAAPAEIRP